ncbi:MAG: DUF1579 family protein [Phycisphaerales bacterium]
MPSMKSTVVVLILTAGAFSAGRFWPASSDGVAHAQPDPKAKAPASKPAAQPDPEAAMMEMMAKLQPGEHHKVLDVMIGNWEGTVKFWMAPGMEPMETTGSLHREWAMDGRWVIEHVDGKGMKPGDPPFKGMGLVGYNTIENKYESAWIENMATYLSTGTGTYDAAKKTFTFVGDMYDPMTMKKVHSRSVVDVSNPNKQTMTGYQTGPDGKEFKNFEGSFTKK